MEAEIARLRIVLAYDREDLDLAVKIARLAVSIGRHDVALEVLQPYAAVSHQGVDRAPRHRFDRNVLGPSRERRVRRWAQRSCQVM